MKNQTNFHNQYIDLGDILDDYFTPQDNQDFFHTIQALWGVS